VSDFESVDYFTDQSLVPDPYRGWCGYRVISCGPDQLLCLTEIMSRTVSYGLAVAYLFRGTRPTRPP
jgi:hypothetical protein